MSVKLESGSQNATVPENDQHVQNDESDDDDRSSSDDWEDNFLPNFQVSYMNDIANVLESHALVSTENALVLNKQMQNMLHKLREKVIEMLAKCRRKYKLNEEILTSSAKNSNVPRRRLHWVTTPYFKDKNGFPCYSNDDYIRRKQRGEFFPKTLEDFPSNVWTLRDKVSIIQGIKRQVLEHLSGPLSSLDTNIQVHSLPLVDLLSRVSGEFQIDWERIHIMELKQRHCISSTICMWNVYLDPSISRAEWTGEENYKMAKIAAKYNYQNWMEIAREMQNRSEYQCFVQYMTVVKREEFRAKTRWTKDEDELLLKLVERHRVGKLIPWGHIFSHFPQRTRAAVAHRYMYSLNPEIKKGQFTPQEDCVIIAAVQEFGENFFNFPMSLFPGRTVVQIRNRYLNTLKHMEQKKYWTADDDKKLLELVEKYGTSKWVEIAKDLGWHSRISCRTRYSVIVKFFSENPNARVEDVPRKKRPTLGVVNKSNWREKVVEIKANPPQPKTTTKYIKKTSYREKLRAGERQYYEYFKYSYDFKLGNQFDVKYASFDNLDFMRQLCDFQPCDQLTKRIDVDNKAMKTALRHLANVPRETSRVLPAEDLKLPPNWSSLLGFRAMCILRATDAEDSPQDSSAQRLLNHEDDSPAYSTAKDLFRKRIFALFYKTGLLSRIRPADVDSVNSSIILKVSERTDDGFKDIPNIDQADGKDIVVECCAKNVKKAKENVRHKKEDVDTVVVDGTEIESISGDHGGSALNAKRKITRGGKQSSKRRKNCK